MAKTKQKDPATTFTLRDKVFLFSTLSVIASALGELLPAGQIQRDVRSATAANTKHLEALVKELTGNGEES